MDNATSIATSRLVAQQRALDVTAANLANADTPGFKTAHMLFSDWLARESGVDAPPGGGELAFTQDRATWRDPSQGALTQTGNPLDIAIAGEGFFTVRAPRGDRLTRAGRFTLQSDGTITDAGGDALLNTNSQPIQLSPTDTTITIAADGTISSENGQIGQIGVVVANDQMRLVPEGDRLLRADGDTEQATAPKLVQGSLESSNVRPIEEMTRMMTMLREFQFASQFVQGEADRQQGAIDKILAQRS